MNGQPVNLFATFVSTKPGMNPSIKIESPTNLTTNIGTVGSRDFEELKERLKRLVESENCGLYFHQDASHTYRFDESGLQHGGVYGLRQRRKEDEDKTRKVTASKLVPLQTPKEFEKHLREVSEVTYMRRGRRNTLRKIRSYTVELCIVLIREKVDKSLPAPAIECNNSGYTQTTSITSEHSSKDSPTIVSKKKKRKEPPQHFTFPARKLALSIFAPIERIIKKIQM